MEEDEPSGWTKGQIQCYGLFMGALGFTLGAIMVQLFYVILKCIN